MIGLAVGVIDFFVSYLRAELEKKNYNIKGITRTNKKNRKK